MLRAASAGRSLPGEKDGKGEARCMNEAWYRVASQSFGYLSAAMIAVIVLLSLRKFARDRGVWRRVRKNLPQAWAFGCFRVLSGGRRLPAGEEIRVPYEGTMGSSHSCDVYIPVRRVHMRSAFFWVEKGELHMAALHRDGFTVDDVPVEPGDEAILREGAVLRVGEAKMSLHLYKRGAHAGADEPYVTRERRTNAKRGRGDGIGAPGKGEARREKKLRKKQDEENVTDRKKKSRR